LSSPELDINARDTTGATALSYAAMTGDLDLLRILALSNADVNSSCQDGATPLHFAVLNQHLDMTQFLLNQGANPLSVRSDNKTPIDIAPPVLKDLLEGRYTSHTHPYTIDFIDSSYCPHLGSCVIGMAMCPGRRNHRNWDRDLILDIEVLKKHGVELVITLMKYEELDRMKLSHLTEEIRKSHIESIHFPITDKWLPDSIDEFCKIVNQVVGFIKEGKRLLVHCNGGKGRTGLLVVGCLIKLGLSQNEATEIIRKVRPGMLRNPAQQVYLMWIDAKLRGLQEPKKTSVIDTIGNFFFASDHTNQGDNGSVPDSNNNQSGRSGLSSLLPDFPWMPASNYK